MIAHWGTCWIRHRSARADRNVDASAFRSDTPGRPRGGSQAPPVLGCRSKETNI